MADREDFMTCNFNSLELALHQLRATATNEPIVKRSTGVQNLDELIGGFAPGDSIVLASRPSMGQSLISVRMIDAMAIQQRLPVLVFSTDKSLSSFCHYMIGSQVAQYFSAQCAILRPEKYLVQLNSLIDKYAEVPLYINDCSGITIKQMFNTSAELQAEHGPLGMIVVTSASAMNLIDLGRKIEKRMIEASKAFKKLAKTFNCPILIHGNVDPKCERIKRDSFRPRLNDLPNHAALSKHADIVLFVYDDQVYSHHSDNPREIIVAQNRNGPCGIVSVR